MYEGKYVLKWSAFLTLSNHSETSRFRQHEAVQATRLRRHARDLPSNTSANASMRRIRIAVRFAARLRSKAVKSKRVIDLLFACSPPDIELTEEPVIKF